MLDLRVYLVTSGMDDHTLAVANDCARAGAGIIQMRVKDATTAQLLGFGRELADVIAAANPVTRLVIDDRVDIALALRESGAPVHGVHLGADDMPVRLARQLLGPEAIIGFTTGTVELVRAAEANRDVIDYLGAGPYRPTPTKNSGRAPLGVHGYPPLVAASSLPIVAIGDVRLADVPQLAQTGIAGVAMVRELMDSPHPGEVVTHALGHFHLTK